MDTINNLANSAVKAVWGEGETKDQNKQEPVSGELGDTNKGEPYDAGNKEENTETKADTTAATDTKDESGADNTAADPHPNKTAADADTAGNPSEAHDSSKAKGDSTKAQNDVRDPADPSTKPDDAAKKTNVDNSGRPKVDGPGPRPLEAVAKEHGGDAGNIHGDKDDAKKDGGDKEGGEKKEGGADDDEDDDGPQKTSHGEGTGEKYVKSSGLKADGGDFDASNPGAGREADRLLEEKGVHREDPNKSAGINEATAGQGISQNDDGEKKKKGLGTRIKEKLHRNSGS